MTETAELDIEHHEIVTDPARVGVSAPLDDEAAQAADESRLGTCPECEGKFAEVVAHAAEHHPGLNLGVPNDPAQLRALADSIEAARAADKVRAEQNTNGGIDYGVTIDDGIATSDAVS